MVLDLSNSVEFKEGGSAMAWLLGLIDVHEGVELLFPGVSFGSVGLEMHCVAMRIRIYLKLSLINAIHN